MYSKFSLLRWFFLRHGASLYSRSSKFQIYNIDKNKRIIAKVKILNKILCLKENILLKKWFTRPKTSFKNNNSILFALFLLCYPKWSFRNNEIILEFFYSIKELMVQISKESIIALSANLTISTITARDILDVWNFEQ